MRLLFSYIKRHITLIVAMLMAVVAFWSVFSLYDLQAEAVIYASLLTLFIFLIAAIIRFSLYVQKHNRIMRLKDEVEVGFDFSLMSKPSDTIEADYRELIEILKQDKQKSVLQYDRSIKNMTDYYTLWAHQIKTPIAAMRLLVNDDAKLSGELFKIEQYVEMVLSYVRTESDTTDYVIKRCKIDDIVRQAIRKYAKLFIGKKLTVDYVGTDKSVITDEKWLQFVIEQLLSNAIKYTASGVITVKATEASLIIADTGIGISQEDLPRVCEKGYTGYNGRADKKSTGIGLYLCKRVLKGLNHELLIASKQGSGTTVSIIFGRQALEVE